MRIPQLDSIKVIEKQYETGDMPVLVVCSDKNAYICKYMRTVAVSYKLTNELVGYVMAESWKLNTPDTAFVQIKQQHWETCHVKHVLSAFSFGSRKLDCVVDITSTTFNEVPQTDNLLEQLLKIALFDFWIANEDRTCNNSNLLYDIENKKLVSIDYGGILNTSTYDYPLSQLTETDSIIYSELFSRLVADKKDAILNKAKGIYSYYQNSIKKSKQQIDYLTEIIPSGWNINKDVVKDKLNQLLSAKWIDGVWINFNDCLKSI